MCYYLQASCGFLFFLFFLKIRLRIGVPFVFLVYWEFFFYYKEGFDFIKFFCVSIEMIIWFSTFSVNAMNYVTLLSFRMLNQLCNFGDTSIGLDVLLVFFLILFFFFWVASISFRIFNVYSWEALTCNFSFWMSLSDC